MTSSRYENLIKDLKSEYRPQREWAEGRGFFLILGHFLVGVAAGGWLMSRYHDVPEGMILAYVFAGLGGLAHLVNIGRPERFLKMTLRVRTSWVSRGFWGLSFFMAGGFVYLLSLFFKNSMLSTALLALPYGAGDLTLAMIGDGLAIIGALIMMCYMGFVYTASKGIAFWDSTLHPVLYISYAIRGGIALLVMVLALRGATIEQAGGLLELWVLVTASAIILLGLEIHGALTSGDDAAIRSTRDLLSGRLALYFYGGTLLVGLVVPLVLAFGVITPLSTIILAAIGLASILGDFFMKYSTVKAGVFSPIRLPHLHRPITQGSAHKRKIIS